MDETPENDLEFVLEGGGRVFVNAGPFSELVVDFDRGLLAELDGVSLRAVFGQEVLEFPLGQSTGSGASVHLRFPLTR